MLRGINKKTASSLDGAKKKYEKIRGHPRFFVGFLFYVAKGTEKTSLLDESVVGCGVVRARALFWEFIGFQCLAKCFS
jgi:hypothetical protein